MFVSGQWPICQHLLNSEQSLIVCVGCAVSKVLCCLLCAVSKVLCCRGAKSQFFGSHCRVTPSHSVSQCQCMYYCILVQNHSQLIVKVYCAVDDDGDDVHAHVSDDDGEDVSGQRDS